MQKKNLDLTQLVKLLGDYLTNTNERIRTRGTLLLSEILTRLPTLNIPPAGLEYLVQFYCARFVHSIKLERK